MPHQAGHSFADLFGGLFNTGVDFVKDNSTAIGVAGQLANQEAAVNALEGLGDDAKKFIGMPEGGLYNTIKGDTLFKPFNVSAIPGNVTTNAMGGTNFSLSPEQAALEKSLRTGGSQLVDAVLGRGEFGSPDPVTGEMRQDARSGMGYLQGLLGDPFKAENLAATEQTAYDRLRAIRTPEEQRAQTGLNQNLVAQGRQGLQTAQFGGSPEQFALSKAIEEQKSADAVSAMGLARQDAQSLSNARLGALQQQVAEKGLGANIASQFLGASYNPQTALLAATQPSLNLADMATTAGRQLGQYGLGLGQSQMGYDLGAQSAAANIRNQTMKGLFDLMIADKNAAANTASAALTGPSGINTGSAGLDAALTSLPDILKYGFKL